MIDMEFHNQKVSYGVTILNEHVFTVNGERYSLVASEIECSVKVAAKILVEKILGIAKWSKFIFENRNSFETI